MTKPEDAIRAVISDSLAPRVADHLAYLADADDDPFPVGRAELLYVWDEYGTEHLDFSALNHPVGHRHRMVLNALGEHHRYYHATAPPGEHLTRWPVQYAKDLAGAVAARTEAGNRVLFCESGRDAVNTALMLATHRTDRSTTAVCDTGWHDWLPGEHRLVGVPGDLDPDLHGALLCSPVDVAAAPVPLADWFAAARAAGIPVVCDESVSGFGRLGTMWGHESAGVPDLTVLGGPVADGLPLGAVLGGPEFFEPELCRVGPQAGHPLACAAGAAMWVALSLGVLDHVNQMSPVFTAALDELAAQFPEHVEGHHGTGFLRGVRLRRRATGFHRRARDHGLLLAPQRGHVVVLAPPLVASNLELKRGVDMLADTLLSWDDETPT